MPSPLVEHPRLTLAALFLLGVTACGGQVANLDEGTPKLEQAVLLPAPEFDETPTGSAPAIAVFAGGCFWGVQGVFQHVEGVLQAVSGYAGGEASTANYETVLRGQSGHAEAVRVAYDPSRVTYGQLLHVLFSVIHDPTQLDRQGPDIGPMYRSTIFPQTAEQREIAERYIAQLSIANVYPAPIVTTIESDRPFYPAEDYHQDFMVRNPGNRYIVVHDAPKVRDLEVLFADIYSAQPVLVFAASQG